MIEREVPLAVMPVSVRSSTADDLAAELGLDAEVPTGGGTSCRPGVMASGQPAVSNGGDRRQTSASSQRAQANQPTKNSPRST